MSNQVAAAFQRSPMLRVLTIAFLVVFLQVPVLMIAGLVHERQNRRDEAVKEVSAKWGRAQALVGPVLVVPFRERAVEILASGERIERVRMRRATWLPTSLEARGSLAPELRRRGIFGIPVYDADLVLEGAFDPPDWRELGVDPRDADWAGARVALGVSDPRSIRAPASLEWNDVAHDFEPGTGGFAEAAAGLSVPVGALPEGGATFRLPLALRGTEGIRFAPMGRHTTLRLESAWPHPSFQGAWLPTERRVTGGGFAATWAVSHLGRTFPQQWADGAGPGKAIAEAGFGVDLLQPVDAYRMADRSVKYAALFIFLTLAAIWIAEVLLGLAVHPVQYLLLSAALCLFYLLELSLAEHVPFTVAYLVASLAVVGMVAGYGAVLLRAARRAALLGAGVAALYGYLYVVLRNEDYALLVDSLGLFAMLAAVMVVTRRVDWYRLGARGPATAAAAGGAGAAGGMAKAEPRGA